MKFFFSILLGVCFVCLVAGCDKEQSDGEVFVPAEDPSGGGETAVLPDGYFEVNFSPDTERSRVAVSGRDGRVSRLRYLLYDEAGRFVKERVVLGRGAGEPSWPLTAVRDTLPKGDYTAVFLANSDKTLFPIPMVGGATGYADVLLNYTGLMADARIVLPAGQFTDSTEYYLAKVSFSDESPRPYVLLQRILSMVNVHRNFVDGRDALNKLVNNIVTQIGYENIIKTNVQAALPTQLKNMLEVVPGGGLVYGLVGGLDSVVNKLDRALLQPITDTLYNQFLGKLVDQIGSALQGNATQDGAVARLGVLLNPWAVSEAHTAIVTIDNYPKTMDFDLMVKDFYPQGQRFRFDFTAGTLYDEKDILIRGFHGLFDIREINVIKKGLISGLLVDQLIDGSLLLDGSFIDIKDPLRTSPAVNRRYKANYSFLDLGLKSYTQQTDGNHGLGLSVEIGKVGSIDGILTGIPILGPLLGGALSIVLSPLKKIVVTTGVNLPLLGVENLSVSGGWSPVTPYSSY